MTIGLANSALKSRYQGSIVNQNQGGGNSKAGMAYQIGRSWHFIHFLKESGSKNNLPSLQKTLVFANQSRPVGSWTNGNTYWHIPGTGNQSNINNNGGLR
jgi:hypothetical protein